MASDKKKPLKDLKSRRTLTAREAAAVKGGRKAGEGQKDFLVIKQK